jgi:hypothetical protein
MDRTRFFAQLDELSPREIEAKLRSWNREQLVLVEEYFAKQPPVRPPHRNRSVRPKSFMSKAVTERTIAAALIALGLVLAGLIMRGGYDVAASSIGAYVVNRFTGATWQCLGTCVRLETSSTGKEARK